MDKIYGHLLRPTKEKTSGSLFFYLSRVGSMVYVTFSIIFQACSGIMLPLTCTDSQDARLPKDFITMQCSNEKIWTMDGENKEIMYHRQGTNQSTNLHDRKTWMLSLWMLSLWTLYLWTLSLQTTAFPTHIILLLPMFQVDLSLLLRSSIPLVCTKLFLEKDIGKIQHKEKVR